MVDMGQADRSLHRVPNSSVHEGVFSRHRERVRALMNEYDSYGLHAAVTTSGADVYQISEHE